MILNSFTIITHHKLYNIKNYYYILWSLYYTIFVNKVFSYIFKNNKNIQSNQLMYICIVKIINILTDRIKNFFKNLYT